MKVVILLILLHKHNNSVKLKISKTSSKPAFYKSHFSQYSCIILIPECNLVMFANTSSLRHILTIFPLVREKRNVFCYGKLGFVFISSSWWTSPTVRPDPLIICKHVTHQCIFREFCFFVLKKQKFWKEKERTHFEYI